MPPRIGIIGGGAAGLMAAATLTALHPTAEVFLLERNDGLGKKVIISGGGRCNVTTGIHDVRTLLTKYPRGGKFLSSAMYAFPPDAVMAWFESRGVPLKTEPDLRAFPQSDDGRDVVRAFERCFDASRVHVMCTTHVVGITKDVSPRDAAQQAHAEAQFLIHIKNREAPLAVDRVILTTGGQAYRHTGSTGDGYAFAMALGHTLTPLAPGLNAFFTSETWPADVSGLSFAHATLTAQRGTNVSCTGPFLFTHKGISGPAVFALASLVAFAQYDAAHPLAITVDLFPDQSPDALRATIAQRIAAHPTKSFQNTIATIIPKSLTDICMRSASLPAERRAAEVSKRDLLRAIAWLKAIPLHVVQRGGGDEFVTAGGIPLHEVNPSTMESRICPGLSFAGEILDVDGFTGGFNLQASWATGHLAGAHIAKTYHLTR